MVRLFSSNYPIGAHCCLDSYGALDYLVKAILLVLKELHFYSIITCSLLAKTHFGESHNKHLVIIPSNPTKFMTTDVP